MFHLFFCPRILKPDRNKSLPGFVYYPGQLMNQVKTRQKRNILPRSTITVDSATVSGKNN